MFAFDATVELQQWNESKPCEKRVCMQYCRHVFPERVYSISRIRALGNGVSKMFEGSGTGRTIGLLLYVGRVIVLREDDV